ncbi:MarR family winged helix-turn-helix transcriptional regulator [Spirilliplanes yamanashiensis]|uniref:HTH marR-type domain-containing protein n=1 Tax=Spirilliplanes yamanashiensis TaxID=42233 RepID=A0A8J3Y460_9ACTN|nr:MarR family transcriptional regulator [Spirilliplanes yamanashiensis]MDP9819946.1 DNA-binding MarR family transcriptional regulator [Spirilliplanes yamanashiensis]GIJ01235.1 hypothetical protein Sya03_05870 [Spirilliplanes yamanashiensis]
MPEPQEAIDRIMAAQLRMQVLFAHDRSNPLLRSHLTMQQLRILILLELHAGGTGRELAERTGVGLATMTGMIDRLAAQGLVARHEDLHDRRVRRIALTPEGHRTVADIMTAGADRQRTVLSRLSASELAVVAEACEIMLREAEREASGEV